MLLERDIDLYPLNMPGVKEHVNCGSNIQLIRWMRTNSPTREQNRIFSLARLDFKTVEQCRKQSNNENTEILFVL